MNRSASLLAVVLCLLAFPLHAGTRPNVVIVITDDQGYGDIAHHGNPVIKTPQMDKLAKESTCLTDYHVAPTCSPTRAALLSGHWTNRTGVWHTIMGRSMIRANEKLMGAFFQDAGYATGMFGKWHLGDNYPYRPEDRGYAEVYRHGGGGVGQTPDVWDNSYFDGGYFHNKKIVKAKGFCTDVFFREANRFIRESVKAKKPFLAYISTNAPHGPLHCPQKYIDMYPEQKGGLKSFLGMITNIDDNIGWTRELLKELGVEKDTIFIFTTDNGTAGGAGIFNAGMRGRKGSEYDGGHRVPMFIHYPAGGLNQEHKVGTVCHAVDMVPTLLDLCGIEKKPADYKFDGVSLKPLLKKGSKAQWPERMLVTDSQRVVDPIKYRKSSVMSQGWRLQNGKELYNIDEDPGQKKNIAKDHPERVAKMKAFYDAWWDEISPSFAETTEIYIGQPGEPEAVLTAHDWIGPVVPWNQGHIRNAIKGNKLRTNVHKGHWAIKAIQDGTYEIDVLRYPPESGKRIVEALGSAGGVPGASKAFRENLGKGLNIQKATLRINDKDLDTREVWRTDKKITFTTSFKAGSHKLQPVFRLAEGGEIGAFYAVVRKVK